ncbi:MAG: M61 family peptidase [Acidobacteriota bacterium]
MRPIPAALRFPIVLAVCAGAALHVPGPVAATGVTNRLAARATAPGQTPAAPTAATGPAAPTQVAAPNAEFGSAALTVDYRVTFPAPEHHWLQVDVTWRDLAGEPLRARMSRSSPGRYSVHEFAKNIFFVEARDGAGRLLRTSRPNADEWNVAGHDGTVHLTYRIFGDRADGTYLGVDTTHARLNMPATFIWAVGFDLRPMRVNFAPPPGSNWVVGTQLFATADAFTFTAPNLQYFMDSPTELAPLVTSVFSVANPTGPPSLFRVLAHGGGNQIDVDALARSVERLVREQRAIYGEFPAYEPGHYSFLLDFVPWAQDDGMEHRNSTFISMPGVTLTTAAGRSQALETIAHEFFHNWNVERIRPAGIEPFDLTRENVTCCLWLAEGFTQYYGVLALARSGLAAGFGEIVASAVEVINGAGRAVRSAVEMSEQAPFADLGVANDVNDRGRTFISYYTYGEAIALGLDLSLRERSNGRLTLDDFMRRLWIDYGAPFDPRPGYVLKPYSLADLRTTLAAVSGDRAFADEFFDKYIEGREVVDYAHLLSLAGYVLRPVLPGLAWIGNVRLQPTAGGLRGGAGDSAAVVAFDTPLDDAGVDEGDLISAIDGRAATMAMWTALAQRKPGSVVELTVRRRDGQVVETRATLEADPHLQVVGVEGLGQSPTAAQLAFRAAWLGSRVP